MIKKTEKKQLTLEAIYLSIPTLLNMLSLLFKKKKFPQRKEQVLVTLLVSYIKYLRKNQFQFLTNSSRKIEES